MKKHLIAQREISISGCGYGDGAGEGSGGSDGRGYSFGARGTPMTCVPVFQSTGIGAGCWSGNCSEAGTGSGLGHRYGRADTKGHSY